MSMKRTLTDEKGSALIICVLALSAILMLAAFIIDLGLAFVTRQYLVNGVDAAALAGVQELPRSQSKSKEVAVSFAEQNGLALGELGVSFDEDSKRIDVDANRRVQFFFGQLLNVLSVKIRASSSAAVLPVGGIRGAAPFAVVEQDFEYGVQYMLKFGAGSPDALGHGNFGILALGGTGSKNYEENIREGYQGLLRVGDMVETEPGNKSGATARGVKARTNMCYHTPKCTYDHFQPGCPRLIYVPVIEPFDPHGRDLVRIKGFAAVFLEGTMGNGDESYVVGRFVEWIVSADYIEGGKDFGLRTYKLVR